MNELHDKVPIVKVFAKVNHKLEGRMVESEGSNVTFSVTEVLRISGVNS